MLRAKRLLLAMLCSAIGALPAVALEQAPRLLKEPLLGVQYNPRLSRFDPLPPALLAPCPMLADNHNMRSHWYVYARARGEDGAMYYISGGYSVRQHPEPPDYPRYQLDWRGVVFALHDGDCTVFDDARAAFGLTPMSAVPEDVLQALARDHLRRLTHALGGPQRLRRTLRQQGIALNRLPVELRQAYRPLARR